MIIQCAKDSSGVPTTITDQFALSKVSHIRFGLIRVRGGSRPRARGRGEGVWGGGGVGWGGNQKQSNQIKAQVH